MTTETMQVHIPAKDATKRDQLQGAGLKEIFDELFSNARRAGATQIDVSTHPDTRAITVKDNGCGIEDPVTLFDWKRCGFTDKSTRDEEPQGRGFHKLGKREVTVESVVERSTGAEKGARSSWNVKATPRQQQGTEPITVERTANARKTAQQGTRVAFDRRPDEEESDAREAAGRAARYLPVGIRWNRHELERENFLAECVRVELHGGVRYGVCRSTNGRRAGEPTLNEHGRTSVDHPIAMIETLWPVEHWWVRQEIAGLPYRKHSNKAAVREIQNNRRWETARKILFRTIREHGGPSARVRGSDEEASIAAGEHVRSDYKMLRPWQARYEPDAQQVEVDPEGIVVFVEHEAPQADYHVLARGLERADIKHRCYHEEPGMRTEEWYIGLRRLVAFEITLIDNGNETSVPAKREHRSRVEDAQVDEIRVTVQLRDANGREERLELTSDIAFVNQSQSAWSANPGLRVTRQSQATIGEIAELMTAAQFRAREDDRSDSAVHQKADFTAEARRIAATLLRGPKEAARMALADAVERHVLPQLPRDYGTQIRIGIEGDISVTLDEDPARGDNAKTAKDTNV